MILGDTLKNVAFDMKFLKICSGCNPFQIFFPVVSSAEVLLMGVKGEITKYKVLYAFLTEIYKSIGWFKESFLFSTS